MMYGIFFGMCAFGICAAAFGQAPAETNLDRVLNFNSGVSTQDMQEVATVIRSVGEIRQLTANPTLRTLSIHGTAAQIALADWLFHRLNTPAGRNTPALEFRYSAGGDDLVRVFYPANTRTAQDLQEVATLVRATAEIRRLFTYNAPGAVVIRGTPSQVKLAEWLFTELGKPAGEASGTPEYQFGNDDVVGIFYLPHTATVQRFQEIAVQVRKATEVRRLFTYNAPRAMALRGTSGQIALAARLVKDTDR